MVMYVNDLSVFFSFSGELPVGPAVLDVFIGGSHHTHTIEDEINIFKFVVKCTYFK
jgi:hypothetical protein